MRGVGRNRLGWGILGIAVLVTSAVGLTLAATARPVPAASSAGGATSSLTGGGVAASTGDVTGPGIGAAWCCTAGGPLGLTATGQAAVAGASAAARALAIARAAADAESQARAAAQGAGISLGPVINVDVSGPSYPYPLPLGAAATAGLPGKTSAAPGSSGAASPGGPIPACRAGSPCPYPGAITYATVTITWAIG